MWFDNLASFIVIRGQGSGWGREDRTGYGRCVYHGNVFSAVVENSVVNRFVLVKAGISGFMILDGVLGRLSFARFH